MNLDLLKKLIKLANNNPNENEANAAARRVCRMLEDEKGNILLPMPAKQQQQAGSWTGFANYNAVADDVVDIINKMRQEAAKQQQRRTTEYQEAQRNTRQRQQYDHFSEAYAEYFRNSPFASTYGWNNTRTENTKIKLKCIKCKEEKETRFRGLPDTWVCMECRGKQFREGL